MRGTQLEIEAADGVADAYLVGPEQSAPRAGVLFLIDAFGVRPTTMEMADRIAAEAARDGVHYLDALAERIPGPVGISGYCMGRRVGWRVAATFPERVAALGCCHTGGLVGAAPDSPHRSAGALRCKLYLGFADHDPSMGAEQIAALERVLDEAGAEYRAEVYAGAGHGNTMADTPVFDEAARERHYRELFALLDAAL